MIARIPNIRAIGAGKHKTENSPAYPAAIAKPDLPIGRIIRIAGSSSITLGCGWIGTGCIISPHLTHRKALSSFWVPHFGQYILGLSDWIPSQIIRIECQNTTQNNDADIGPYLNNKSCIECFHVTAREAKRSSNILCLYFTYGSLLDEPDTQRIAVVETIIGLNCRNYYKDDVENHNCR